MVSPRILAHLKAEAMQLQDEIFDHQQCLEILQEIIEELEKETIHELHPMPE
jgi:hypothetical protein